MKFAKKLNVDLGFPLENYNPVISDKTKQRRDQAIMVIGQRRQTQSLCSVHNMEDAKQPNLKIHAFFSFIGE